MRAHILGWIAAFGILGSLPAFAEPTTVVVRVMAKGAKFVGDETGGAKVTLRDAATGKVLAEGLTTGTTGPTPRIMTEPHPRDTAVADAAAAKFSATLDLDQPRLITATAVGPMKAKDRAVTVSSTQWVVPGKSVNGGDGWVLELPGFVIDLEGALPQQMKLSGRPQKIPLRAKITMQCGCPITPGGLWDAGKLEVGAILLRNGKPSPTMPLTYAGTASTFAGDIEVDKPGDYTLDLYAYAPWDGNTDVYRTKLHVK